MTLQVNIVSTTRLSFHDYTHDFRFHMKPKENTSSSLQDPTISSTRMLYIDNEEHSESNDSDATEFDGTQPFNIENEGHSESNDSDATEFDGIQPLQEEIENESEKFDPNKGNRIEYWDTEELENNDFPFLNSYVFSF